MIRLLLSLCLVSFISYSQNEYGCAMSTSEIRFTNDIPERFDFIPDANTPMVYIRVNIHFQLTAPNHPDYPSNFTKDTDGYGNNNYNGYRFAMHLIDQANRRIRDNHQMNLPVGNTTPKLPFRYQYILNGVYFNEDSDNYIWGQFPHTEHAVNSLSAINVYYLLNQENDSGGRATMTDAARWVEMREAWQEYNNWLPNYQNSIYVKSGLLNHEIGHNLSLHHTVRWNWGPCGDVEDHCDDTPSRPDMTAANGSDPCCGWGGASTPTCSNNLMDYSGADALTPEQLGRIHWTFENELQAYKACNYGVTNLDITASPTDNQTYNAENVTIPSNANITVSNNDGIFINAETFDIDGEFTLNSGSVMWVYTKEKCN